MFNYTEDILQTKLIGEEKSLLVLSSTFTYTELDLLIAVTDIIVKDFFFNFTIKELYCYKRNEDLENSN